MEPDLKPCPFDNFNCMCQFCKEPCNNGLNCSNCNHAGYAVHEVFLCTEFVGDIDSYIENLRRHQTGEEADNG